MDSFLFFERQPNGSMALSPSAIVALESRLSAARTANKHVSIVLICGENLSIQLQLRVHPTTSWGWRSTWWQQLVCSQQLESSGSPGAESGEGDTWTPFTSEFGKGE